MPLPSRLVSDSGWSLLASVLSRIGAVLAMLLAVRVLGKDPFGALALAQSTALTLGGAVGLGLGTVATALLASARAKTHHNPHATLRLLSRIAWSTAVLLACATLMTKDVIARHVLESDAVGAVLGFSAPLLALTTYTFYQQGALAGLGAFRETAQANLIVALFTLPTVTVGVLYGGVQGALAALIASSGVTALLYRQAVARRLRLMSPMALPAGCTTNVGCIVASATPLVLLNVLNASADWVGFAMLARHEGGVAEVGVYCALNQWSQLLRFVPMAIGSALLPKIALELACDRPQRVGVISVFGLAAVSLATAPAVITLTMASEFVVGFYGSAMDGRVAVLSLLALSGGATAIQITTEKILGGMGLFTLSLALTSCRVALFCGFAYFVASQGAEGLATARLLSSVVHASLGFASLMIVLQIRRVEKASAESATCVIGLPDPISGWPSRGRRHAS